MTNINYLGIKMLLIHIVIASLGWFLLDISTEGVQIIVYAVITAVLIVLWKKAIQKAYNNGRFLNSVIAALYFIVPSILTGAAHFYSSFNPEQLKLVVFDLCWSVFNYPLSPGIFQSDTNIWIKICAPVVLMGIILLVNYIESRYAKVNNIIAIILAFILFGYHLYLNVSEIEQYDISQLTLSSYNEEIVYDSGVTFTASMKTIPVDDGQFELMISNDTSDMVSYDDSYRIETAFEGKWYAVPLKEGNSSSAFEKREQSPYATLNIPVDFSMFDCYPGRHRIIKEITIGDNTADNNEGKRIIVTGEFNLY